MLADETQPGDPTESSPQNTDPTTKARRPARAAGGTPRVRVSTLARELGITSKLVLARLSELGHVATSAASSVEQSVADQVRAGIAAVETPAAETPAAEFPAAETAPVAPPVAETPVVQPRRSRRVAKPQDGPERAAPVVVFVAPEPTEQPTRRRRAAKAPAGPPPHAEPVPADVDITVAEDAEDHTAEPEDVREAAAEEATGARRRRRRGRRGRGGGAKATDDETEVIDGDDTDAVRPDAAAVDGERPAAEPRTAEAGTGEAGTGEAGTSEQGTSQPSEDEAGDGTGVHRRRRRRRSGAADGATSNGDAAADDPPNTVVHVRTPKTGEPKTAKAPARSGAGSSGAGSSGAPAKDDDGVRGVKGSTRLEARRQRRRDGRDTGRKRPPILTESEFLARRESVDRVMAVRQIEDRTQIAVLEDDVLVEHYVTRARADSYAGNVYLGRVQNVLPSMEAAFIDIGKGRNGVLYAGEVNWDAAGLEGKSRAIENALKPGTAVLVQVSKDPIGHKGARLTSQISLPGRFLVYVPGGGMTGISRRLPDTERHRLKSILKKIVPEDAGVIVRTAAEGASEQDLTRDVERLQAEWATISKKAAKSSSAPQLMHGEPDLAIRVVRDVFNEDFATLSVQGAEAWATVSEYVDGVAPDLRERVSRHTGGSDLFHNLRVDEQLAKALDRKVWLPSGGSLVIDRTEAMTVIDVNTGKFVGSGGNLEQTVTRNNLEAAEEIVRQLRLRDVGGMIVIDFIDMVLESNRDLVLRRLTECLGRDRTKHQVAEVTSLGLVQMTRKRVGEGLLEAFSEPCEVCHGRGVILHSEPVETDTAESAADEDRPSGGSSRRRGRGADATKVEDEVAIDPEQKQKALAAMVAIHRAAHPTESGDAGTPAELEIDAIEAVLSESSIDPELLGDDLADGIALIAQAQAPAEPILRAEPETGADEPATDEPAPDVDRADPAVDEAPVHDVSPAVQEIQPEASVLADEAPRHSRPRRRRAASRPAGPPVTA